MAPPDFGTNVIYLGALVAGGFVIALLLRATGWWRNRLVARIVIAAQIIGALAVLVLVLVQSDVVAWQAAVTAVAVVAAIPTVPWAVDAARQRIPHAYKYVLVGGLAAIVIALALPPLADTWIPRALVAAIVLVAATVLGGAIAHLNFFNAFSLLYRWNMHSGELDPAEAATVIEWRSGNGARASWIGKDPPHGEHGLPQLKNPGGPIHKLVAEIFDALPALPKALPPAGDDGAQPADPLRPRDR